MVVVAEEEEEQTGGDRGSKDTCKMKKGCSGIKVLTGERGSVLRRKRVVIVGVYSSPSFFPYLTFAQERLWASDICLYISCGVEGERERKSHLEKGVLDVCA